MKQAGPRPAVYTGLATSCWATAGPCPGSRLLQPGLEGPEPNGFYPHTHRAAAEVSGLGAMSSGEDPRAQDLQGVLCVRVEASHPACLSSCLFPPSPPCPSLCPALAGQQMMKSGREEPWNSSYRREAGGCASRVHAWELAPACPGQEAWVF